jgi:hypothetical protein
VDNVIPTTIYVSVYAKVPPANSVCKKATSPYKVVSYLYGLVAFLQTEFASGTFAYADTYNTTKQNVQLFSHR